MRITDGGRHLTVLPSEPHDEKELALRALARERGVALNEIQMWIGSAFKRYLYERGWRFKVLATGPDPDVPGTTAYMLRVKSAPADVEG
jgi:hypothetical protein